MPNDVVFEVNSNTQPFIDGMNRAASSARKTSDEIEKYAAKIRSSAGDELSVKSRIWDENSAAIQAYNKQLITAGQLEDVLARNRVNLKMASPYAALAESVRRDLMTPRDIVVRDILAAKAAWKAGELDAKHYFDYVAQQKSRLQTMNAAQHMGYTDYGGRNMRVIQQLAFGVEDFATQAGTMGIAGGLRAASNNISAAGMMMGPMVGLAASAVSTVTMLGVMWYESTKRAKEHADALKDIEKEYNSIENIVKRVGQAAEDNKKKFDMGKMTADQANEAALSAQWDIDKLASVKAARESMAAEEIGASLIRRREEIQAEADRLKLGRMLPKGESLPPTESDLRLIKEKEKRVESINKALMSGDERLAQTDITSLFSDEKQAERVKKNQMAIHDLSVEILNATRTQQEYADRSTILSQEEASLTALEDEQKAFAKTEEAARSYFEETRTNAEKLAEELKKITKLQQDGFLAEETAIRAVAKAREQYTDKIKEQKKLEKAGLEGAVDYRFTGGMGDLQKSIRDYLSIAKPVAPDFISVTQKQINGSPFDGVNPFQPVVLKAILAELVKQTGLAEKTKGNPLADTVLQMMSF